MEKTSPPFPVRPLRRRLLGGLLLAVMALLAGRLAHFQTRSQPALTDRSLRQQGRRTTLPARLGDILDARHRLLATAVQMPGVFVNPAAITQPDQVARSLALALELDPAALAARIRQYQRRKFLWVKRRVSAVEARSVRDLRWPEHWVGLRLQQQRRYPQAQLACHVLGRRDVDGIARDGIELACDQLLGGLPGYRITAHDAFGRTLTVHEHLTRLPRPGRSIVLTIDSVIQTYAEQALDAVMDQWKPQSATAIVMDPHTGDVLAMANRPAFEPNGGLTATPNAWVNRAISDRYEPGSTFKPFVMAAALDWGVVEPDELIDCHQGVYHTGGRVLHSHHPNGELTPAEILIRSDNIGMAIVGQRLGNRRLFRLVQLFGFGRRTGIGLPGESPGLVRPLSRWTSYSTTSVPMGQELAVTPLQLITAFAALANGGRLLRPRIIRAVLAPDGRTVAEFRKPIVVASPVGPSTARSLVTGALRRVVEDRHGTGRRARLVGYTVFGKTGTAQLADGRGGYAPNRHVSSFLAGAPAADPRLVVLVMVNDPSVGQDHYGGRVAAPAAARILHRSLVYLRVPPDKPQAVAEAGQRR